MKTSELTGAALDWAVAKCMDWDVRVADSGSVYVIAKRSGQLYDCKPSSNWAQGGPIIEREGVNIFVYNKLNQADRTVWCGHKVVGRVSMDGMEYSAALALDGPTPLIAAMRCYVASKLGDEIEVPVELN